MVAFNSKGAMSGAMGGAGAGAGFGPQGAIIGGLAGGVLGGFMGGDDGEAQYREQQRLIEESLRDIENIPLPELERIAYENPEWLENLVAMKQQDSELRNISTDPRLKNQQMAAMSALDEIVQGGGMTAADEANLSMIQNQAATADRGRREAIMQNMDQRGMGGSGLELLNQLQSSQAATDRQAQGGLDVAAMAQQRALDSMMNQGQMAGQMRSQDFGEQSRIAQAQDVINQFNTQNQMRANEFNTAGRQDTANMGTDLRNRATQYNTQLPQQNYENEMNKAGMKASARGAQVDMIGGKRREDLQTDANRMGSMVQMGSGIADYYAKKEQANKNNGGSV